MAARSNSMIPENIRRRMNGTDLYSSGDPVLRRLTAETQFRSQARAIIERIKSRT